MCGRGGQRNKWCQEWDSLASEVAGYKGTMADSDSSSSEKPKGSESGLGRLEALIVELAQKMAQYSSAMMARMDKMELGFSGLKQEATAAVVQLDRSREKFREELVAARRRCEGSTEVV